MTVRELINILEDIEDVNAEIVIETSDGFITEVELVEPEEQEYDDEDMDIADSSYKLVGTEYI